MCVAFVLGILGGFFLFIAKDSGLFVDTDNLFAAVCHTILSIFLIQLPCWVYELYSNAA